jgi:hypothetical protein
VLAAGAAIDAWRRWGLGPAEGRRERACALVYDAAAIAILPRERAFRLALARYQKT